MALWKKWETETKKQAGPKRMKTFAETSKGKEFKDKKGKPKKKKKDKLDDGSRPKAGIDWYSQEDEEGSNSEENKGEAKTGGQLMREKLARNRRS